MWLYFLIIVGVSAAFVASSAAPGDVLFHCQQRGAQKHIAIDLLMGRWHIVEVIHHLPRDRIHGVRYLTLTSCPLIHLLRMDDGNYRINWIEDAATIYYDAKRSDPNVDGYWVASGPHNITGTRADADQRYPFSGIIEVMKAVSNHAVLTFCRSDHYQSHLFSVILAREFSLPRNEVRGVNNMLLDRQLPQMLIKKTCNGAAKLFTTSLFAVFLMTTVRFIM